MAATSFYVISTVFVILVGSPSCKSLECTADNLIKCATDSLNGECPQYKNFMTCLESIEDCTDEGVKTNLTRMQEGYGRYDDKCPGMAEDTCFLSEVNLCNNMVPWWSCDDTSGFKKGKECMEALKSTCTNESNLGMIDQSIKRVDVYEAKCAR